MPVQCDAEFIPISEQAYYEIDYEVYGVAQSIQNEFGRLCNEGVYQREIAYRCGLTGRKMRTEVPVQVSYDSFRKTYYTDLLVDDSVVFELKAVESLSSADEAQTLNYLLLTGLNHGSLINMRPQSVSRRFMSTSLTPETRCQVRIVDRGWVDLDDDSADFKRLFQDLVADWGAFFGGGTILRRDVIFSRWKRQSRPENSDITLGDSAAFKITAISKDTTAYESQISKFLELTSLDAIQWVNFDHHDLVFKTVSRAE